MKATLPIYVDDADGVLIRHTLTVDQPEGHPLLIFQGDNGVHLDIHLTHGRLLRLMKCGAAYLAAHPADVGLHY